MFHHSKSGKISYGIVGVGRFGSALACELAAAGAVENADFDLRVAKPVWDEKAVRL